MRNWTWTKKENVETTDVNQLYYPVENFGGGISVAILSGTITKDGCFTFNKVYDIRHNLLHEFHNLWPTYDLFYQERIAPTFDLAVSIVKNSIVNPCPPSGEFLAYKLLALTQKTTYDSPPFLLIATLKIPADARRVAPYFNGGKCRAEKAEVVSIVSMDEVVPVQWGWNIYKQYGHYKYVVGETVEADEFDDSLEVVCSGGIHFYMVREDVELMGQLMLNRWWLKRND